MAGARRIAAVSALVVALSSCATLTQVSVPTGPSPAGTSYEQRNAGPTVSGDGRYSVYSGPRSAQDPTSEVFRRDHRTGTTVRVSSDPSGDPVGGDVAAISRDGRFVVFRTAASLVASDTNRDPAAYRWGTDYYVRDMSQVASYELVSLGPSGDQIISEGPNGLNQHVYVSATGRYVAFQFERFGGRTFGSDIYVRDRQAGTTTLVDGGYAYLAGLSGDGLHVGVDDLSACTGPCPVSAGEHVTDWKAGTSITIGCEAGGDMPMSDDGRFVAAVQTAKPGCAAGVVRIDLAPGGTGTVAAPGVSAATWVLGMTMSADGSRIAFATEDELLPTDTNGVADVYVTDFLNGDANIASRGPVNTPADGASRGPSLSADGRYVLFTTDATNLVADDLDRATDAVQGPAVRPEIVDIWAQEAMPRGFSGVLGIRVRGVEANAVIHVSGDGITLGPTSVVPGLGTGATIEVAPDATPGPRDVWVTNPGPYGDSAGWCFGCLTIT